MKTFYDLTSKEKKEYLKEFITESHDIPGPRDILFEDNDKSDLILVYRKK